MGYDAGRRRQALRCHRRPWRDFSRGITSSSPAKMGITVPTQSAQQFPASLASPESGATGGSEIYMIAPDGSTKRIWSSHDDIVYALGLSQRGQLLAGTGNKGRI